MNFLSKNDDNDVAKFFTQLGFRYTWNFAISDGLHWHEISDQNGRLLLQIEMGIPIERIVEELMDESDRKCPFFMACDSKDKLDMIRSSLLRSVIQ